MFYQKIQIIIDFINKKESFDKTNDFDIDYLIKLCKNHSMLPLLYVSLKKYNIDLTDEQEKVLSKAYKTAVYTEAVQETEKSMILASLSNNNIKCIKWIDEIKNISSMNSLEDILNKINILVEYKDSIKFNVNSNLLMDSVIISIGGVNNGSRY